MHNARTRSSRPCIAHRRAHQPPSLAVLTTTRPEGPFDNARAPAPMAPRHDLKHDFPCWNSTPKYLANLRGAWSATWYQVWSLALPAPPPATVPACPPESTALRGSCPASMPCLLRRPLPPQGEPRPPSPRLTVTSRLASLTSQRCLSFLAATDVQASVSCAWPEFCRDPPPRRRACRGVGRRSGSNPCRVNRCRPRSGSPRHQDAGEALRQLQGGGGQRPPGA